MKKYEKPELEVIELKVYDVITTSLDVEEEYDSNGTLVSVE